jgi:hypothetical protein
MLENIVNPEQWLFHVTQLEKYHNWPQDSEHNPDWTQCSLAFNSANCFEKECHSKSKTYYTDYTSKHKSAAKDQKEFDIR